MGASKSKLSSFGKFFSLSWKKTTKKTDVIAEQPDANPEKTLANPIIVQKQEPPQHQQLPQKKNTPELRFNMGSNGYLGLRIASPEDAIKILVLLRGCKSGLYYNKNSEEGIIWSNTLKHYNEINKILKQEGYLSPDSS